MSEEKKLYRVSFINQDKVYEVFAREVYESDLYGFLGIEKITFGNKSNVVIDPTEEKLKAEFETVERTFIPLHNIIRIDEVKKQGVAKIKENGNTSNISTFPVSPKSKSDLSHD